ncbi:MAG: glycosyltransferase family 4 protein [Pontiellaceae bacterium]|nr:glycosyltransferase family 4 protein [Pontiellaceae bacterium]MBN2783917.1 glycosyltransferase family 4 protein [Pontiellaceae bacterium]
MRVVFYSGVFARIGGIEEFTLDLARALIRAGVKVRIVCASLKNPALRELANSGAEVWKSPVYYGCRWNIPDYFLLPLALIAMRDADVVIHQKPFNFWFYRLLSKKPSHIYLTSYRPLDQFKSSEGILRFFSRFDGVITQTDSFGEELRASGLERPVYILPLIPPEILASAEPQMQDGILRIGLMGRLVPQKNPLYAMHIVNCLEGHVGTGFNKVELHIYGDGCLIDDCRQKAADMKADVVFHGAYRRQDIGRIVAENDCFLITSVTEGQCIVALEILSGGRPVFSTPVGALPDVLSHAERGGLLPDGDPQGAADCIVTWIKTHGFENRSMIQASYTSGFDASRVRSEYIDLLKQVAGEQ